MKAETQKRNEDLRGEFARLKAEGWFGKEAIAAIAKQSGLAWGTVQQIVFNRKYPDDSNDRQKTARGNIK